MSLFTILEQLDPYRGMEAALLVLAAAYIAIAAWDLRLALPALGFQYLAVGLLYVDHLDPRLAMVFVFVGLIATVILIVTAWQLNWGRPPDDLTPQEQAALGAGQTRSIGPFSPTDRQLTRLGLATGVLIVLLIVWQVGGLSLDSGPADAHNLATLGLAGLGLVGLAVAVEPIGSGIGLLLLLNGFELYYTTTAQSMAMIVALVAVNLVVALVISYMAQTRSLPANTGD